MWGETVELDDGENGDAGETPDTAVVGEKSS